MPPRVFTEAGTEIEVGAKVSDGFEDNLGEVTFCGEDEGRIVVDVDFGRVVERYLCAPRNYRREGPEPENWVAPDLAVVLSKRCIDCNAPITDEALKLNHSGLWCVKCEHARRDHIDQQMGAITAKFDAPNPTEDQPK